MAHQTLRFLVHRERQGWTWVLTGDHGAIARSTRVCKTRHGALRAIKRFRGLPFMELPIK